MLRSPRLGQHDKRFSLTANLREIHVISLAVSELGSIATRQFIVRPASETA